MDTLLKKYAERIELCVCTSITTQGQFKIREEMLQFLLEYVELKENKKDGE